jgi:hypothetical protein
VSLAVEVVTRAWGVTAGAIPGGVSEDSWLLTGEADGGAVVPSPDSTRSGVVPVVRGIWKSFTGVARQLPSPRLRLIAGVLYFMGGTGQIMMGVTHHATFHEFRNHKWDTVIEVRSGKGRKAI